VACGGSVGFLAHFPSSFDSATFQAIEQEPSSQSNKISP
jgi:hypothetical protein